MSDWGQQPAWRRGLFAVVAAICLLHFLVVGLGILLGNTNSNSGDQGAFLSLGLDIREGRALTDGNRHPLFPLLIAPFARRQWSYFTLAKLVSLCAGLATLVVVLVGGARLEGPAMALVAVALLSLNVHFLNHGPRVLCEGLLTGLSFAAWWASVRSLERPGSWRAGAVAGALTGAVYLTKGSGNLTVTALLLSALLLHRRRAIRSPGVWAFFGALLLVASPLLAYNWARYGNPLYNYNSVHAIWFDRWGQHYLPADQKPTLGSFLATHSLQDIGTRQFRGMFDILPIMAEALALRGVPATGWATLALAGGLVVWGLWGGLGASERAKPRAARGALTGSLVLAFYLFFSWYAPVNDEARFFLPVVPIVYLMGGRALALAAARIAGSRRAFERRGPVAWVAVGALALACLVSGLQALGATDWESPFGRDARENQDSAAVIEWLDAQAGEELRVLWGPSHSLPTWLSLPQVHFEPIPYQVRVWPALEELLRSEDYAYLVIDRETHKRRKKALNARLDRNGKEITFRELPEGWTVAYAQKGVDTNWYVIDLGAADGSEIHPLASPVRFGEAIALRGWGIQPATLQPGGSLEATLLWEAVGPLSRDLTVFVHLLDAQGQRVAQSDSYPMGGMYPTSRWQTGEVVQDRHTLYLSGDASPGRCRLIVGFYDLRTGERLPVAGAGSDNGDSFGLPQEVEVSPG